MSAEKRVLLASLLSVIGISLYSQVLNKTVKPRAPIAQQQDSSPQVAPILEARQETGHFVGPLAEESFVAIESSTLGVEIGASSGAIRRITLKRFLDANRSDALHFGETLPLITVLEAGKPLTIRSVEVLGNQAKVSAENESGKARVLSYSLDSQKPLLSIALMSGAEDASDLSLISAWARADMLKPQQNRLELYTADLSEDKPKYKHFGGPWKAEKNVPRGTFLLALAERHFCMVASFGSHGGNTTLVPSSDSTIAARTALPQPDFQEGTARLASVYIGPRDYFKLKEVGFGKAFPIGVIGQIGLILLALLGFLAKLTHSYGIALILFSIAVTVATAPFTILSIRSMKRMQQLKPHVDKLMAQHKNDPQKANKEVFALYKEHKVSPLGGCLPMLLQMPIFIALFQAMSHFIELRGARFWKIADLSLPDQMIRLPGALPLVGDSINVLPVIMAVAMYFQTQASQKSMGAVENNPTAQMMSGPLMPVLFLFMFYGFPSGLVLYWLTNSLMSMLWYRLVK